MKKFKECIAWFLALVFMIPTAMSCSRATDISNIEDNLKYREMAKSISVSQKLFIEHYAIAPQSRTFDYGEISQEDIDYYASLLGFEEGDFQVELVDAVLEKYIDVIDRGYEQVLEDFELTEFTKLTMVDIAEGRWIEDIESHPNYENLNLTEKEMLSLANAYAQELEERDMVTGEGIGAFFGMIIGGFLCNVWCVLGGAIIGGIIGSIVAKNQ